MRYKVYCSDDGESNNFYCDDRDRANLLFAMAVESRMFDYVALEEAKETVKYIPYCDWKTVGDWLDEIPAADVVEVIHGHWISQQEAETINDYGKAYCCSICGHCDWDCTESESFNYCPHCGAKMDGERRSE